MIKGYGKIVESREITDKGMCSGGLITRSSFNILPQEDSFEIQRLYKDYGIIVVVADGITRDCKNGKPATADFSGLFNIPFHYPKPSPAKQVADLFTFWFLESLYEKNADSLDEEAIKKAFAKVNEIIAEYNKRNFPNPNYLEKDLAGCVGAGAVILPDRIIGGQICDSGIRIFDPNLYRESNPYIAKTTERGPEETVDLRSEQKYGWNEPEGRIEVRKDYRNKPEKGKYSFGVLTGEESALEYVTTLNTAFSEEETVLLFTDGLKELVENERLINLLRSGIKCRGDVGILEKLARKQVGTEGTLAFVTRLPKYRGTIDPATYRRMIEPKIANDMCP